MVASARRDRKKGDKKDEIFQLNEQKPLQQSQEEEGLGYEEKGMDESLSNVLKKIDGVGHGEEGKRERRGPKKLIRNKKSVEGGLIIEKGDDKEGEGKNEEKIEDKGKPEKEKEGEEEEEGRGWVSGRSASALISSLGMSDVDIIPQSGSGGSSESSGESGGESGGSGGSGGSGIGTSGGGGSGIGTSGGKIGSVAGGGGIVSGGITSSGYVSGGAIGLKHGSDHSHHHHKKMKIHLPSRPNLPTPKKFPHIHSKKSLRKSFGEKDKEEEGETVSPSRSSPAPAHRVLESGTKGVPPAKTTPSPPSLRPPPPSLPPSVPPLSTESVLRSLPRTSSSCKSLRDMSEDPFDSPSPTTTDSTSPPLVKNLSFHSSPRSPSPSSQFSPSPLSYTSSFSPSSLPPPSSLSPPSSPTPTYPAPGTVESLSDSGLPPLASHSPISSFDPNPPPSRHASLKVHLPGRRAGRKEGKREDRDGGKKHKEKKKKREKGKEKEKEGEEEDREKERGTGGPRKGFERGKHSFGPLPFPSTPTSSPIPPFPSPAPTKIGPPPISLPSPPSKMLKENVKRRRKNAFAPSSLSSSSCSPFLPPFLFPLKKDEDKSEEDKKQEQRFVYFSFFSPPPLSLPFLVCSFSPSLSLETRLFR